MMKIESLCELGEETYLLLVQLVRNAIWLKSKNRVPTD